ncbi:MAG TPA: VCBS repeat-containing protein, partial [Enhygromyxa sp.]|nr:VCBS repeat-containing protein [Enhygromyxa sp.]
DFDAVVLSLQTPERLLVNDATGNFAGMPDAFPPPTDSTLWGEFGDLNGDGRLDLVTGAGEFAVTTNHVYFGNDDMAEDTTAPIVITHSEVADVAVGEATAVLFAVSDNTVTDEGPRLDRAYARLDIDGSMSEVDGWFVGGDLFRVELDNATEGTVSLELCAEDRNGNVGCSDPVSFQVGEGGGDGDGDGDPSGDGDGDPSGDGDGDPATGDGDGDGSDETGDTGGGAADSGGDGCNCSVEGDPTQLGWSLLSLLGLGLVIRRRR